MDERDLQITRLEKKIKELCQEIRQLRLKQKNEPKSLQDRTNNSGQATGSISSRDKSKNTTPNCLSDGKATDREELKRCNKEVTHRPEPVEQTDQTPAKQESRHDCPQSLVDKIADLTDELERSKQENEQLRSQLQNNEKKKVVEKPRKWGTWLNPMQWLSKTQNEESLSSLCGVDRTNEKEKDERCHEQVTDQKKPVKHPEVTEPTSSKQKSRHDCPQSLVDKIADLTEKIATLQKEYEQLRSQLQNDEKKKNEETPLSSSVGIEKGEDERYKKGRCHHH